MIAIRVYRLPPTEHWQSEMFKVCWEGEVGYAPPPPQGSPDHFLAAASSVPAPSWRDEPIFMSTLRDLGIPGLGLDPAAPATVLVGSVVHLAADNLR